MDNENELHPVMARVRQFERLHGERYGDSSAYYFADGAVRDAMPQGALIEPPDASSEQGEHQLALNQLTFAKLKLKAAVNDFDFVNTQLANSLPMDEDAELAKLKRLAKVVTERKRLVAKAEEAVRQTAFGRRRAEMLREQQEQAERIKEFQDKRRMIRV